MPEPNVIKDARILNAISRRYPITYDKIYKYIVKYPNNIGVIEYNGHKYKLQFFSGCMYPYLIMVG